MRVEFLTRPIRRFVVMLLVAGLTTLVPLAHATPPDPTWIPGLYDDGDHDAAVAAISDASGLPTSDAVVVSPARPSSPRVTSGDPARSDARARLGPVDRAPPRF